MTDERFLKLKPLVARNWLPAEAVLSDPETLRSLYDDLDARAIASVSDFETWVLDRSELAAGIGQAGSILYIEMTCDTADAVRAKAYQDFVETIEPLAKEREHRLDEKFFALSERFQLDPLRYGVYVREAEADVKIFRAENIPVQTKISLLSQEYQAVTGAMTVHFDGKERTLPEMSRFLLETDRPLRERAWRAVAERRRRDENRIERIFDDMRGLREQVARNAGFKNFRDYQFAAYHRFDYTPDDCKTYHRSVRDIIVPIRHEIDRRRRQCLGVESLRPWDTAVDVLSRPALRPFSEVSRLEEGVGRIVRGIDQDLAELYEDMRSHGLLDLASRKGKAPGGYQNTLDEVRKPFIFMNAVG
ncbi:MAG: M3 family oligoendopeptidase, partial [Elusimicrobia bacterium]|nr:M3 family oligoendopeptidase [Elusimicrobiota bacterium]